MAGHDESLDVGEYDLDVEAAVLPPTPATPPDSTCALIQRGNGVGAVADTDISFGNGPNWPTGHYPYTETGLSTHEHRSVFRFDLTGVVPAGKSITLAVFNVYVQWNNQPSTVNLHRVVLPWNEATATYNNFGGDAALDWNVLASFDGSQWGFQTLDITDLAKGWHSGDVANHGILLREEPVKLHYYNSSESGSDPGRRPSLYVCWSDAAPPDPECEAPALPCGDSCCNGICNEGVCIESGAGGAGGSGAGGSGSGSGDPGTGGSGGGNQGPECKDVGSFCAADADCCDGSCADGMCIAAGACLSDVDTDLGAMCDPWNPCCDGFSCVLGFCFAPDALSCKAPEQPCDWFNDMCCWGLECNPVSKKCE